MKWNGLLLVGLLAASCGQGNDVALDVKLGNGFGCVLDPGQGVYCWGANNFGQLGLTPPRVGLESGVRHSEVPVLVAGTQDARSLYLGASHACILTSNDVLCWGSDEAGQIG
jgi:alpha-tubulin suppressor-like RCC1 family protein